MPYEKPSLADHGTLRELTAVVFPDVAFGIASTSSPVVPPDSPPPGGPDTPGPTPSGEGSPPPGLTPDGGGSGGDQASGGGGADGGGIAGAEAGGGGGAVSTGGGDASLPFTGFAAAMVGAIGAGMAAAGTALRRVLRRRDHSSQRQRR